MHMGKRLVCFCLENNFKIVNSFYKKRTGKKWTWLAPNGIYKTEFEYFLTPHLNSINKFEVINKFPFYTESQITKNRIIIKFDYKKTTTKLESSEYRR